MNNLQISMYEQLHSEINQRLDLRQGTLTFTLLVAASLFGLGLQQWVSALTVLCYPPLALFLACVWEQHDVKIGQIAAFLRQMEDSCFGDTPGWERWRREHFKSKSHLISIPAKGVFLASDLLGMLIALARLAEQTMNVAGAVLFVLLFCVDCASIILTIIVLRHVRQR